ncbi:hypothetical protein RHGRI_034151 [Rhododendron griersonianum]|uniref:Secreted protein n=1 Tax=Rhododendron griersonianum TaxID=479676 RepID=A0AAV6I2E7_9ERIC|nr:hypothetical protein RHGRI_034151 [Rhododendron griersonianum]
MVVLLLVLCYSADVIADVMLECFFASDSITLKLDPFCWLADYSEDFGCNSDVSMDLRLNTGLWGYSSEWKLLNCLAFG